MLGIAGGREDNIVGGCDDVTNFLHRSINKIHRVRVPHKKCVLGVDCVVAAMYLHIFKLIYSAFGVAFPDFSERLILVPTLFDVLLVDSVHRRLA